MLLLERRLLPVGNAGKISQLELEAALSISKKKESRHFKSGVELSAPREREDDQGTTLVRLKK